MSFFSRFTRKSGKSDNALYAQVWREVESKNVDEGLWARVWAENKGHEEKTKAAYLKERVRRLQDSTKAEEAPASSPTTEQPWTPSNSPPEVVKQGQHSARDFSRFVRTETDEQSAIHHRLWRVAVNNPLISFSVISLVVFVTMLWNASGASVLRAILAIPTGVAVFVVMFLAGRRHRKREEKKAEEESIPVSVSCPTCNSKSQVLPRFSGEVLCADCGRTFDVLAKTVN